MATPDDLDSEQFTDIDDESDLDGLEDLTIDDDSDDEDLGDLDYEADEEQDVEAKKDSASGEESEETEETELEDEDPDEEEESLDVILAREQDLEEEFARTDDSPRPSPTSTPPGEDEFTCRSCFLVKRRAQLAPGEEGICLDCA